MCHLLCMFDMDNTSTNLAYKDFFFIIFLSKKQPSNNPVQLFTVHENVIVSNHIAIQWKQLGH